MCPAFPTLVWGFSVLWHLSGAWWSGGKLIVGITPLLHHMCSGHLPIKTERKLESTTCQIGFGQVGLEFEWYCVLCRAASPCCQWKSHAFYSFLTCPLHDFFWKGCPTDHGRTKCQHAGAFTCCPLTCWGRWGVCQHFPGHIFSCFF